MLRSPGPTALNTPAPPLSKFHNAWLIASVLSFSLATLDHEAVAQDPPSMSSLDDSRYSSDSGYSNDSRFYHDSGTTLEYGFSGETQQSGIPHRVIRQPVTNPLRSSHPESLGAGAGMSLDGPAAHQANHANAKHNAKRMIDETLHTNGPLLRHLHERRQPTPAIIPSATIEPRWKAPYAYGYFGASGTKSWTKSYGYRDTHKRWTQQ